MRYFSFLALLTIVVLWSSCRKDFDSDPSTGNLSFSVDTLFLDTIFTNISSSTYSFKVYNRTDEDFTIPSIRLERGENSNYRLNVDGIPGKSFNDIQVLANDSIFVFVETTTDILDQTNDLEFLYTDKVLFDPNGVQQDVDLVTLVKDAVFLFPSIDAMTGEPMILPLGEDDDGNTVGVEGFFLDDDDLTFTNEKPYVIYGYAAIPSDKTLTIEAGARIHFHENSGIIAANQSTLIVNGELSTDPELMENEVIFQGDRLEPSFSDVPGQWGTIWLTAGSTGHIINHATIKNGIVGIIIADSNDGTEDPTLTISNTQIYNCSNVGILAQTAHIKGENLVINNAGETAISCLLGGRYNFNHCTFTNFWNNSFRNLPAVQISNFVIVEDTAVASDLVEANFDNCIIDGSENIEFSLNQIEGVAFNYRFRNCLMKFNDFNNQFEDNPLYDFSITSAYSNVTFNEDPDFKNPRENELNIGENSAANGKALIPTSGNDILGTPRNNTAPDIGAYESVTFDDMDN